MHRFVHAAAALGVAAAFAAAVPGVVRAAELEISQCKFPEPPTIPSGAEATEAEMGEAGANVREFVAEVQSSLACLSEAEQAVGEEITEEQQAELVAIYNNGVDQMNSIAENYNEQVRAFKAR